jgi:sugar-specific transcriptional regulator TrmB
VVDSMRRAIGRARERLTGVLPARELAELGPSLASAAQRGVSLDLVTDDGATADLPDGDGIRIRRRSDGDPDQGRLAVVVGDGSETVLADLGRDQPEGMWTHHPAVALLVAEHLRRLGGTVA